MTNTNTSSHSVGVLHVPGARLHYELRGDGPLVVLVGDPMDAAAFAPLAEVLATDHTVLTTDPRGINRSVLDDPEQDSTPELRAEDLSALLVHLDRGPATVVGSSGGAATALALAQAHPDQARTVVAHEPPMDELLEDRERLHAESEDVIAAYAAGDVTGAWTKFFAQANIALPNEVVERMFGGERNADVVADERRWFLHSLRNTNRWMPDIEALREGTTRVVIGVGDASAGEACDRISRVLADELGLEPTIFPGDHTAFVDDPEGFAARLRSVLDLT